MKKIILTIILVLGLAGAAGAFNGDAAAADTWHRGISHNLAWDAVTTYEDGTPVDGEAVSYSIFIKNVATGAEIKVGTSSETAATAVLPSRGRYRFGVQATLGEDVSPITWSDNAEGCANGELFGGRWLFPFWPKNFKHR
ncbi:MAG TPA: hypothetical protein DDZ88_16490 [Verrucomicrobiales bacterium]|nr:hypothetical protein [Verrucomicrobiales bacterium]